MVLKRLCFIVGVVIPLQMSAQGEPDWEWWCQNVGCTGNEHWVDFITISPKFMGPNALPVPAVSRGRVDNQLRVEFGIQAHFSDGDDTQNIFTDINLNMAKDIVSLRVYAIPQEHFDVTDETRDLRKLSGDYYEPEGFAKGDVYFGVEIQLIKDKPVFPDMMIRAFTKTATGSETGGARFTDTPGYYFDLSLGKNFIVGSGENFIRPYGMLGFYSWQTYDNDNPQNDAPLYGLGGNAQLGRNVLSTSLAGYSGWKDNGDDPLVFRLEYLRKNNKLDVLLQYQLGLNDYDYTSVKLSLIYHSDLNLFNKD